MTTPADYPSSLVASLWGGVREDIQNNHVAEDLAALTAAQAQATVAEQNRRELASQTPGVGAPLPLPQPPADAGMGSPPVVGEGYSVEAPPQPLQVVVPHGVPVHGQRPVYGAGVVGGVGFQAGRQEPPIRVLVGTRSAGEGDSVVAVSPPRRSLLSRLLRRGRA
jgi:hypothetical protein